MRELKGRQLSYYKKRGDNFLIPMKVYLRADKFHLLIRLYSKVDNFHILMRVYLREDNFHILMKEYLRGNNFLLVIWVYLREDNFHRLLREYSRWDNSLVFILQVGDLLAVFLHRLVVLNLGNHLLDNTTNQVRKNIYVIASVYPGTLPVLYLFKKYFTVKGDYYLNKMLPFNKTEIVF